MKKKIFFIFALFLSIQLSAQVKVIAHRGYWKIAGSAQNSLSSLRNAARIRNYGSEFDVWMTKDEKLVVNHDKNFKGVDIENTISEKVQRIKLDNGENLPLLTAYLKEALKHKELKLILEMKALSSQKKETRAVQLILEEVKEYQLLARTVFISFSLHACEEFIKQYPKAVVFYLNGDLSPKELYEKGISGLDYHYKIVEEHPEWIKEAHALGLKVNVWTINDLKMLRRFTNLGIDFVTTNNPEVFQQRANKLAQKKI